jgi:hypothetical protein
VYPTLKLQYQPQGNVKFFSAKEVAAVLLDLNLAGAEVSKKGLVKPSSSMKELPSAGVS